MQILLFVSAIGGAMYFEQGISIYESTSDASLVQELKPVNSKAIQPFLMGHEAFYADLFWVHTVRWSVEKQYQNMAEYIFKMADLITDLDPRFEQVYIWAGSAITYVNSYKMSAEDKVRASNRILEKGWNYIQNDVEGWNHYPRFWMIPQFLGFNYGFELKDKEKALEYTQVLMTIPGLPPHMKTWAAGLYRDSGDKSKGLNFLENLLAAETIQAQIQMTDDEEAKEKLQGKLLAFYNKLNTDEYGRKRMAQIQESVRNIISMWRKDYPFLPFQLYVLMHDENKNDMVQSLDGVYDLAFPNLTQE